MAAATGITPPALRDRPKLHARNRQLLQAFYAVSAGRSYGEAGGFPIPTESIFSYAQGAGLRGIDERMRFFVVMRELDGVYLTEMSKKRAASAKK